MDNNVVYKRIFNLNSEGILSAATEIKLWEGRCTKFNIEHVFTSLVMANNEL